MHQNTLALSFHRQSLRCLAVASLQAATIASQLLGSLHVINGRQPKTSTKQGEVPGWLTADGRGLY